MKGIIKKLDLVVYPVDIIIVMGDVEKEVNTTYKHWYEEFTHISPPPEESSASTYIVESGKKKRFGVLIWVNDIEDITSYVLSHEAGHAAIEIFKFIGAQIDVDNQEPFCYLLGTITKFITRECLLYKQQLEKKNE